ncbi:MAG: hypothetical protein ABL908_22835, partial [Hyphomicrobium sp.]
PESWFWELGVVAGTTVQQMQREAGAAVVMRRGHVTSARDPASERRSVVSVVMPAMMDGQTPTRPGSRPAPRNGAPRDPTMTENGRKRGARV